MKMRLKKIMLAGGFMVASTVAFSNGNSAGKINRIYHNSDGFTYIRLSSGNNTTECYNSGEYGSHRLRQSHEQYGNKISLLMFAYATGKTLKLKDSSPPGTQSYCDMDIIIVDP